MTPLPFIAHGSTLLYISAVVTALLLTFNTAPYGRYTTTTSPSLPARLAWFIFELPNLAIPLYHLLSTTTPPPPVNLILLAFFLLHYTHRALIYPLRIPTTATPMPIHIIIPATIFCSFNASLQSLSLHNTHYPPSYFLHPRFILGFILAFLGFLANILADHTLLTLRKSGSYQIPRTPLFRLVSCPNFAAEIIEWSGWALACSSHPAAAFALYTVCNTAPRAISHHRFYRQRFHDYPRERKALIPFLL